jgi:hypothetical protein
MQGSKTLITQSIVESYNRLKIQVELYQVILQLQFHHQHDAHFLSLKVTACPVAGRLGLKSVDRLTAFAYNGNKQSIRHH